jgi:hypothetical protein
MKTVVDNALKKYIKSRQAPASESIKRFKEMNKTGFFYLGGGHKTYFFSGGCCQISF